MKQLILCERPFMVYKALLKGLLNQEDEIDIVLSNHMLGMEKLQKPIIESGIFHEVFFFDDKLYQDYIREDKMSDFVEFPQILIAWPKKLKKYFSFQKYARKEEMPLGLDFRNYDEILANDGVSTMNFKLNFEKIPYVVSEHGRGNFRNKIPLHILAVYISIILDRLNIIVAYSGCSKYVTEVEVDRNEDLVGYIKRKPIRECRISELEGRLTTEQRNKLYEIYAKAYELPLAFEGEVNLLLTGPLVVDKILASEEDQIQCYQDAVKLNCDPSKKLMIKPHPRDTVDYREAFPDAIIVDRNVTSEILSCCKELHIDKVVTIYSTSISSFKSAREMIVLGDSFMNGYHRISKECGGSVVPTEELNKG